MIDVLNPTPYENLSCIGRADIILKLECQQFSGSFKARGVGNFINHNSNINGLVTFTTGNQGIAVASLAKEMGIKAIIVVNDNINHFKRNRIKELGCKIITSKSYNLQTLINSTQEIADKNNYTFVPLFGDENLLNGYAQIADEILNDFESELTLFFPIGTGSLLLANSKKIKKATQLTKVVGVEPLAYQRLSSGFAINKPSFSVADSLSVDRIPESNGDIKSYIDGVEAVSEKEIKDAMAFIFNYTKIMVEPGAAVSLAAALKTDYSPTKKIAVITGKNISSLSFKKLIANL